MPTYHPLFAVYKFILGLDKLAQDLAAVWQSLAMLVQRASYNWAYSEDIPGSRCGPDDGPWPRSYQVLNEEDIWRELRILAKPQSVQFDTARGGRADSINFQPSPSTRTQDRYVVKQLNIHGRRWTLTGVFDGTISIFFRRYFGLMIVFFAKVTWVM